MRLLILHQNFPGQFRHLAQAWARTPGWEVVGLGRDTAPGLTDVPWFKYSLHRDGHPQQHPYLRQMEKAVLHGQAVARALFNLKSKGFKPDTILAHPGWGETLYAKDVFPDARLIHFCEWYYGQPHSDMGFDPEFPSTFDTQAKLRTWNALHTLNLENCDAAVTPTRWQWQQHPQIYRSKIQIAHEGIDIENLGPNPQATLTLPNGQTLKAGDPVITYVARNLEPYRGFHIFMRALESIQKQHKTCHAVIVGGDGVSYGSPPSKAANWREKMLAEVTLDPTRTHFLGKVPYDTYKQVLQVSAAHIYLTYPFVLSWSMLEAMASGCLVIGSRTAPVQEVLTETAHGPAAGQGANGTLVDFFSPEDISNKALQALDGGRNLLTLREQARTLAQTHYTRAQGLAMYQPLVSKLSNIAEPAQRLSAA